MQNSEFCTYDEVIENTSTPSVQFTLSSSSGDESTTSPSIEVRLSATHTSNVQVNYAVTGGTATGGGTDYTGLARRYKQWLKTQETTNP